MIGNAEQVTQVPSARRAPRAVLPSTATARSRPRASILACPGQGPRVHAVQDHPVVFSSGARYRSASGSRGRSGGLGLAG